MPEEGRERLRSALLRPSRSQLVVGVLMMVLGFAAVVQVRDYQRDDTYSGLRETELIEVLDGLTGTAERARREVARLEGTRDELSTESGAREAALAEAQQRVQALNILSGAVAVKGPGVRVTITETAGRASVGALLDMVQELRTAGAEAMEFNDEHRLAVQSSFNATDAGVELDGNLLESPYVFEAIGDPHVLKSALLFSTGPVETLENYDGATVEIEELDNVTIRSVREQVRPTHAEPLPSQQPAPHRVSVTGDDVYPEDLKYTAEHEWVRTPGEEAGAVRVGITDFAQDALGDIVYVSLPQVGDSVTAGETCGELESTKSVSDVYAPVSGEVVAVNDALDATPELVNNDPYEGGWLFEVRPTDEASFSELLDSAAYQAGLEN